MLDNPIFSFDQTVSNNLKALSDSQSRDEERRICELFAVAASAAELSEVLIGEGMDIYSVLAVISEGLSVTKPHVHGDALACNRERLLAFDALLSVTDRVFLASLYLEKMRATVSLTEGDFLPSSHAGGRIVYVKNAYSDEAYDVFSAEISNPRVGYADSLKEAVRAVSADAAQYCLLPLEERGARIASVEELLFLNELRIASVTPVFGYDGAADMKYALVSKHYRIPRILKGDEKYLEIMLPSEGDFRLDELLLAASILGNSLYRVKSSTFRTADGVREYYTAVLKGGTDFTSLLVYLTLFAPSATVMGIYKNIE